MPNSNARRVLRPEELAGTDLTGFVSRGFQHFSGGIRYRIAFGASAPEARAEGITLAGTPVEEVLDQDFTLAFNSYIALSAFGET